MPTKEEEISCPHSCEISEIPHTNYIRISAYISRKESEKCGDSSSVLNVDLARFLINQLLKLLIIKRINILRTEDDIISPGQR